MVSHRIGIHIYIVEISRAAWCTFVPLPIPRTKREGNKNVTGKTSGSAIQLIPHIIGLTR